MRNSDTVTAFGAWLGLERDTVSGTKFRWIDGTPLEREYENWFDGQPDNHKGKEECVNMFVVNNCKNVPVFLFLFSSSCYYAHFSD